MGDETADPSIGMMFHELNRAEDPLETTQPLPSASTGGMSVSEIDPSKEHPETSPTSNTPMAEGPIVNSDSRPAAEAYAAAAQRMQDRAMAMENNPVTTAEEGVLGAYNNATDQETHKPSTPPESSAINWMVPTFAATPSRISFDGS